jgi:hypothetical protein
MPKVIVLFYGGEGRSAALAEAAAEGASRVRFTEVDVRAGANNQPPPPTRHKVLDPTNGIRGYDGAIFASPAGAMPLELSRMLEAMEEEADDAFTNTVFAIAGTANPEIFGRVARLGGLIVSEPRGTDSLERSRALGVRVATVVGWVRHALSHEHH